jgi:hypothetical protein
MIEIYADLAIRSGRSKYLQRLKEQIDKQKTKIDFPILKD